MNFLKRIGPFLLLLVVVLVLLLVVFRDKISHKSTQQNISTAMMNTDAEYIMPMVELTQRMQRITGKTKSMLQAADAGNKWENRRLMLESMDGLASDLRELMDQTNAMLSNQSLMNNAEIRPKVDILRKQMEIMLTAYEKYIVTIESIQEEMNKDN
ncbi:hypothetical protein GF337_15465 [candidate division KSB1 bacterium]|nr:hypothetical protein [candidate division KSB1 bacterium]